MVLYTDQTDEVLNCWLVLRNKINLVDDDALLVNQKKESRQEEFKNDGQNLRMQISLEKVSPHVFRHNFATAY